jgi:hypothetical protein
MALNHQCDAGSFGDCPNTATVDFGKYIRVVGLGSAKVRHLCCTHARGLRAHRGCPCKAAGR